MTNPNLHEIFILLDRSGSMGSIASDVIGSFNVFLDEQKKSMHGDCILSLVQFDDEYEVLQWRKPIQQAENLTKEKYVPRSMTALYDSWGKGMVSLGMELAALKEEDRPGSVTFVVLTDGLENASHEYKREDIFKMVKEQEERYSWDFVYLGANQDAMAVGEQLGTSNASTMTYSASAIGTRNLFSCVSEAYSTKRATKGRSKMDFTEKMREEVLKESE